MPMVPPSIEHGNDPHRAPDNDVTLYLPPFELKRLEGDPSEV